MLLEDWTTPVDLMTPDVAVLLIPVVEDLLSPTWASEVDELSTIEPD